MVGKAIRYLEAHESHCILLVLGTKEPLPETDSTVPVTTWTHDYLPLDKNGGVTCGSMIVTHSGPKEESGWVDLLPWIRNPLVVTPFLEWIGGGGFRNLERLEPTFLVPDGINATRFAAHTWKYHKQIEKFAIFNGDDQEYWHKNGVKSSTLRLKPEHQLNFGNNEFAAVAFRIPPYSLPDYQNQENSGGFEYEIASLVTKGINIRLIIRPPSTGFMWGNKDATGNYTGKTRTQVEICTSGIISVNANCFRSGW